MDFQAPGRLEMHLQAVRTGDSCGTIIKKEGVVVVELDQFKYTLNNYAQPLTELRDSL